MAASTVDTSATDVGRRPAIGHRSAAVVLATGLLGYLVSGTGTWLAVRQRPWDVDYGFRRWDGAHYLTIAVRGYSSAAMPRHGPVPPSNWAFFPGYPLAMRAVHLVGVPWHASAWLVNGGSGLLAFWVVALLMRTWYDERVAVRTAQALAVFPGACLLVFAYAEGLFLLLAATCLLAVRQRRWPAAGLACCAAGGVRSQGAFLALLLGVVAVLEVRRRRELRALLAPALAPWGFVGFLLFAWRSTGRPDAWYAAQRWGWGQRDDFQAELWRMLTGPRPFSNYQVLATVFGAGCLLLVVAMGIVSRRGIPRLLVGYTLAMLLPLLANSRLGLRPRFLLPAFPLMALPARALHRWTFVAYCVLSSAGLLWAAYWFAGYVPP
jgi:hypothetical protein